MKGLKHLIIAALLAGGVFVAGTSSVDAHSIPAALYYLSHDHRTESSGHCAYRCSALGHNHAETFKKDGDLWCWCCSTISS